VVVTGLSVAGAFGVARLIFQDGHLSGLLNFTPQGFVDAWGPLFFGAMVFGVAMDYTLFLLTAAKERRSGSPTEPRERRTARSMKPDPASARTPARS
jgi:RND superfamily putative drug exporter